MRSGTIEGTFSIAFQPKYGPLTVNSTVRSRSRNRSVGGRDKSYHLNCQAVDFRVHGKASGSDAASVGHRRRSVGLKRYPAGYYHIDTGTAPQLVGQSTTWRVPNMAEPTRTDVAPKPMASSIVSRHAHGELLDAGIRRAIFSSSAKCGPGVFTCRRNAHQALRLSGRELSRQRVTNDKASFGSMPAFCSSEPVLTWT